MFMLLIDLFFIAKNSVFFPLTFIIYYIIFQSVVFFNVFAGGITVTDNLDKGDQSWLGTSVG